MTRQEIVLATKMVAGGAAVIAIVFFIFGEPTVGSLFLGLATLVAILRPSR